jgi:hypothetical protein
MVSWETTPHAVLQCKDEWEIQSVATHDVAVSVSLDDEDDLPNVPATSNFELPVVAKMFGQALLTIDAMLSFKKGLLKFGKFVLKLRNETINKKSPVTCGSRWVIVESDVQTVEGDADVWMRTRKQEFPFCPKFPPRRVTIALPEETLFAICM